MVDVRMSNIECTAISGRIEKVARSARRVRRGIQGASFLLCALRVSAWNIKPQSTQRLTQRAQRELLFRRDLRNLREI